MPKGYWMVHLNVDDPAAYQNYRAFVAPFLERNGGRFVIRGGRQIVPEGKVAPRSVLVEFPSFEQAEQAYYSAEYQEGLKLRTQISQADFAIVEGVDG
jgi:uncharacterized protein (DUF1330 family)